jgi:hypothetical protein
MRRGRTSTSRRTLRLDRPELPSFPHDELWRLGPRFDVARLVIEYLAEMERLERSQVFG